VQDETTQSRENVEFIVNRGYENVWELSMVGELNKLFHP